ncbi:hypothetical protein [Cellulosimicrobium funkei]
MVEQLRLLRREAGSLVVIGSASHSARVTIPRRRIGYLLLEPDVANLFSSSCQPATTRLAHPGERLQFSAWGTVFAEQAVAAALIDRIATTPKSCNLTDPRTR